jgi:hypothetical protein
MACKLEEVIYMVLKSAKNSVDPLNLMKPYTRNPNPFSKTKS